MDKQAFFWKIANGELPPPKAGETLGIVFKNIDTDAGTIELELQGRPEFTNPTGNIQGGFLAAMLDDTLGTALAAKLKAGEFAPTLNLNVSFHRAGKVGTFVGKGRVLKHGKDVCYLAGELYQNDELVASATATALIRAMAV
jgi:uncharacterized protein (TIGR00369 family)